MKRISHVVIAMATLSLILSGCSEPSGGKKTAEQRFNEQNKLKDAEIAKNERPKDANEEDLVTVQHLLVSFSGSGTNAIRSKADASVMAKELFEEAKTTDDFPGMIQTHTDDSYPGIYQIANYQVVASDKTAKGRVHRRTGLVPAFGNVGFSLEVGEIGMAEFDPEDSPFGWHIIKRIK